LMLDYWVGNLVKVSMNTDLANLFSSLYCWFILSNKPIVGFFSG